MKYIIVTTVLIFLMSYQVSSRNEGDEKMLLAKGYKRDVKNKIAHAIDIKLDPSDLKVICREWNPERLNFYSVTIPAGYLTQIGECSKLKALTITNSQIKKADFFPFLPDSLERLSLDSVDVLTNADLATLPRLSKLKVLDFSSNKKLSNDAVASIFQCCSQIDDLSLYRTSVDKGIVPILMRMPNLNRADLEGTLFSEAEAIKFGEEYEKKYKRQIEIGQFTPTDTPGGNNN